jgi:polyisoprenyl-teichoic acid--peptidoglycan teichoic acid transferase
VAPDRERVVGRVWSLHPADHRRRTARGLGAAALSVLVPGAGHLAIGERRRGGVLLSLTLGLVAGIGLAASLGPLELLALLLRPGALTWLTALNLALLGFRLVAALDAYALGARPATVPAQPRTPIAATALLTTLALLAVLVGAPHVVAGYYTVAAQDLLDSVFVAQAGPDDAAADRPAPATPDRGDGLLAAAPDATAPDAAAPTGPLPAPSDDPSDPALQPPPPPDPLSPVGNPWFAQDRINLAVLGSDAGPGRWGARIDSLLVVSVEPRDGDVAIFSLSRSVTDFPLPDRLAEVYRRHCPVGPGWEYLNAVYTCGVSRVPEAFAAIYPDATDPAAAATADVLGELLGIPVEHYAMVDMGGFVGIVDALGGVEVAVGSPLRVRLSPPDEDSDWRVYDIPAGVQTLDGPEALAFVRSRSAESDRERMRRQRCLLASLATRTDPLSLLRRFPSLAGAIEEHVTTSVPVDQLPDLLPVLAAIERDRMVATGVGPIAGGVPDVAQMHAQVAAILADPGAAANVLDAAEEGDDVCS